MHPMSCLRHHHLRLTFEAAFEFGRDEKEHRGASLSRHQERRAGQLPQISTVERRVVAEGSVIKRDRNSGPCFSTNSVRRACGNLSKHPFPQNDRP